VGGFGHDLEGVAMCFVQTVESRKRRFVECQNLAVDSPLGLESNLILSWQLFKALSPDFGKKPSIAISQRNRSTCRVVPLLVNPNPKAAIPSKEPGV
jgi:hypothetical protein